jgi:hypothetical protein
MTVLLYVARILVLLPRCSAAAIGSDKRALGRGLARPNEIEFTPQAGLLAERLAARVQVAVVRSRQTQSASAGAATIAAVMSIALPQEVALSPPPRRRRFTLPAVVVPIRVPPPPPTSLKLPSVSLA